MEVLGQNRPDDSGPGHHCRGRSGSALIREAKDTHLYQVASNSAPCTRKAVPCHGSPLRSPSKIRILKMKSPKARFSLFLFAAALSGTPAMADFITGQVVDSGGVGVQGINIDVYEVSSGDAVDLQNGGTNSNGDFTATLDSGFYHIVFIPPPPPATTHLILTVEEVVGVLGRLAHRPAVLATACQKQPGQRDRYEKQSPHCPVSPRSSRSRSFASSSSSARAR